MMNYFIILQSLSYISNYPTCSTEKYVPMTSNDASFVSSYMVIFISLMHKLYKFLMLFVIGVELFICFVCWVLNTRCSRVESEYPFYVLLVAHMDTAE